ncbi:hypothetical protein GCM10020258_51660 [Sphingomonas yabuuchiae]
MNYDVAYRYQQALDPSSLATIATTLHAVQAAIKDARNAGCNIETDPAVILLARHFETLCAQITDRAQLESECAQAIDRLQSLPALPVLAYRGVAHDEMAKRAFHREEERPCAGWPMPLAWRRIDIRSPHGRETQLNRAKSSSMGRSWVRLSLDVVFPGQEVTYRRVRGRDDHWGDRDRVSAVIDLLDPDRFAARLRRELSLGAAANHDRLAA